MLHSIANGVLPPSFLKRLLVATDGSESGDRAVAFAIALALGYGSQIEFCNAFDRDAAVLPCCNAQGDSAMMMPLVDELEDISTDVVRAARKRALAAGIVATSATLHGRTVISILNCANAHAFDAVIVGTRATSGIDRMLEGSTADGVMRESAIPVFVVPPGSATDIISFRTILLAIDDSEPSDAARDFGIAFAKANHARLTAGSVAEASDGSYAIAAHDAARALVDATVARARAAGVPCEGFVVSGDPAACILEASISTSADLIVLGTHGRRGIRRWFVGSVAETVARESRVPIVALRM